jgi:hypothetical protein
MKSTSSAGRCQCERQTETDREGKRETHAEWRSGGRTRRRWDDPWCLPVSQHHSQRDRQEQNRTRPTNDHTAVLPRHRKHNALILCPTSASSPRSTLWSAHTGVSGTSTPASSGASSASCRTTIWVPVLGLADSQWWWWDIQLGQGDTHVMCSFEAGLSMRRIASATGR